LRNDFFASDELVSPLNEKNQKLHRNFFQLEHTAPAAQLVAAQIEF